MASTTYRSIPDFRGGGRFTREQLEEAVRAVRLAFARKEEAAKKKAVSAKPRRPRSTKQ
jgi:hypothetical protein